MSQLRHEVAPVRLWYNPAAQLVQADARAAEYVPVRQLKQLDDPTTPWNVPAAQLMQVEDAVDPVDVR